MGHPFFWLRFGSLDIPLKGRMVLWVVGVIVFLIGIVELATKAWTYENAEPT
jgi:hypothetical protein